MLVGVVDELFVELPEADKPEAATPVDDAPPVVMPPEGALGELLLRRPLPRGPTLTMTSSNCSGVVSRPSVSSGSWKRCRDGAGGWPTWPAGASRFWPRRALATSMAFIRHDANFCGSSQTRML